MTNLINPYCKHGKYSDRSTAKANNSACKLRRNQYVVYLYPPTKKTQKLLEENRRERKTKGNQKEEREERGRDYLPCNTATRQQGQGLEEEQEKEEGTKRET